MSEDRDKERRSETAKAFYRRYRAQTFQSGQFTTPSSGSASGVAGFGLSKKGSTTAGTARANKPGEEEPDSADLSRNTEQLETGWTAPPGTYRSKNGTGRSRWDPAALGDVLGIEVAKRGWDRTLSVASVTGDWEQIVGPQVAQHCPIESFEGGTLIARADSTAWAQQLQILLPHIHRRIDERVGPGIVEKVIVRAPQAPSWVKGKRTFRGGRGPRDTYG